jgi:hypothetical protein
LSSGWLRTEKLHRRSTLGQQLFTGLWRTKQSVSEIGVPKGLLARIILVLLQPPIVRDERQLMRLTLLQRLWSGPQIGQTLEFGKRIRKTQLRLRRIARLQA